MVFDRIDELKRVVLDGVDDWFFVSSRDVFRDSRWKEILKTLQEKFNNRKRFNCSFFTERGRFVRVYFNLKSGVYYWRYVYE